MPWREYCEIGDGAREIACDGKLVWSVIVCLGEVLCCDALGIVFVGESGSETLRKKLC